MLSILHLTGRAAARLRFGFAAAFAVALAGTAPGAQQPPQPLDLKGIYGDPNTWYRAVWTNFSGRRVIDGLPFDIGGEAKLYGSSGTETDLPKELPGIRVGRTFEELDLIHFAGWPEVEGRIIATVRLNYADGTHADLPICYGAQVRDWFQLPSEAKETLTDTNTKVVWRHEPLLYHAPLRVFKSRMENPFPGKRVETIDLVSAGNRSIYTLVAATVADRDPSRPVSPSAPPWGAKPAFDSEVRVLVVDAKTRQPLPGVDVTTSLQVGEDGVVGNPVATSSNGIATVRYPSAGLRSLYVGVKAPGYRDASMGWEGQAVPGEITISLSTYQSTNISGIVVDNRGRPVANASVQVLNFTPYEPGQATSGFHTDRAYTDAEGRWTVSGLPVGFQHFGVQVEHPGFPTRQFFADGAAERGFAGPKVATADFLSGRAVLSLEAGRLLAGTVCDTNGRPIANANVFAGFDRHALEKESATTGTNGTFALTRLTEGEVNLTVSAAGYAPEFLTRTISVLNTSLVVTLMPGRQLKGRVLDPSGKPVPGVRIEYTGISDLPDNDRFQGRTLEWNTTTDSDGRFSWDSAPQHAMVFDVLKDGYMQMRWARVPLSTNEVVFQLSPPLRLHGAVADADTGEPVPEFKITPAWLTGGSGRPQPSRQRAQTFRQGAYEVTYEDPLVISSGPVDYVLQVEADGYAPALSKSFRPGDEPLTIDFRLKRTPAILARLLSPEGRPVAGAEILCSDGHQYLQLSDRHFVNRGMGMDVFRTDDAGKFKYQPRPGPVVLLIAAPEGFAMLTDTQLQAQAGIQLQAWGRIEGALTVRGRPGTNEEIFFNVASGGDSDCWSQAVRTDATGRFVFDSVPPGPVKVYKKVPTAERSWTYQILDNIVVEAGGTNRLRTALDGQTVTGRLKFTGPTPPDFQWSQMMAQLQPLPPKAPVVPADIRTDPDKMRAWFREWQNTDAGRAYQKIMESRRTLKIDGEGGFRGELVLPGTYRLMANISMAGAPGIQVDASNIVVTASTNAASDALLDLGEFPVTLLKSIKRGEAAPDFHVKTLDGQPLDLSGFRGKYVLLDFWATWCGPCVAETPHLKEVYDKYGKDPKFAMISLSLDSDVEAPRKFSKEKQTPWIQGFLGDWGSDKVTGMYGVHGIPAIFLVGPDGKVVSTGLRGAAIGEAVGAALGKP
ncbi:MAG: carboxypeptidase regulatory-like domain-containing protein [Verrucomicrobiota bacterium]